ncbi:hypothetical protein NEFER03_0539 [Nematocida sp. LUAm3]|nr:hypothetical protein NEFER03_0539 [Nematocida sp. LUAm3]KAI5175506.1 hypothetical protein NEFER02_1412 [Nematocida sp. LUAm2]KAI5178464.1 hypothetical protein NEFER01_1611 [Nematocida sp. LUAm1]
MDKNKTKRIIIILAAIIVTLLLISGLGYYILRRMLRSEKVKPVEGGITPDVQPTGKVTDKSTAQAQLDAEKNSTSPVQSEEGHTIPAPPPQPKDDQTTLPVQNQDDQSNPLTQPKDTQGDEEPPKPHGQSTKRPEKYTGDKNQYFTAIKQFIVDDKNASILTETNMDTLLAYSKSTYLLDFKTMGIGSIKVMLPSENSKDENGHNLEELFAKLIDVISVIKVDSIVIEGKDNSLDSKLSLELLCLLISKVRDCKMFTFKNMEEIDRKFKYSIFNMRVKEIIDSSNSPMTANIGIDCSTNAIEVIIGDLLRELKSRKDYTIFIEMDSPNPKRKLANKARRVIVADKLPKTKAWEIDNSLNAPLKITPSKNILV